MRFVREPLTHYPDPMPLFSDTKGPAPEWAAVATVEQVLEPMISSALAGHVVSLTGPGDDDVVAVAPIALVQAGLAALGRSDTDIQAPGWAANATVREVMNSLTSSVLAGHIVCLFGPDKGDAIAVAPMAVVEAGKAHVGRTGGDGV